MGFCGDARIAPATQYLEKGREAAGTERVVPSLPGNIELNAVATERIVSDANFGPFTTAYIDGDSLNHR